MSPIESMGDMINNLAYYEKDEKIMYVNRDFYFNKSRKYDVIYVLLHEYYHSTENYNSSFNELNRNIEDADVFVSGLFKVFEKHSKFTL